jgi:hypothetical protein
LIHAIAASSPPPYIQNMSDTDYTPDNNDNNDNNNQNNNEQEIVVKVAIKFLMSNNYTGNLMAKM